MPDLTADLTPNENINVAKNVNTPHSNVVKNAK